MSFFQDILKKIKKPVDALKEFLTPKEQKVMKFEVGAGLTPEQRVKAEETVRKTPYQLQPGAMRPSAGQQFIEGVMKGVSAGYSPDTLIEPVSRVEKGAKIAGELVGAAVPFGVAGKVIGAATKLPKIAQFATRFPRLAKMIKAGAEVATVGVLEKREGKTPLQEPVARLKGIPSSLAFGAILGSIGKKESQFKNIIKEYKYELPADLLPARGTKPTWKIGKKLWNTMRSGNVFNEDLARNKGGMIWIIDKLSGGKTELEPLLKKYAGVRSTNKQYKKLYAMFKNKDYELDTYKEVMAKLKGIEPMVIEHTMESGAKKIKPTEELKQAVKPASSGHIHSKNLEKGIDDAYYALDKAGHDAVYDLGKVGDYIDDPVIKKQYQDVLDTPLYIKRQVDMKNAHGSLSVNPKGEPVIVLSDGLTKDSVDRTLIEELTHAKQFKKGVTPTQGVPYQEIPEEIRAKKAAKHFAPGPVLEDIITESKSIKKEPEVFQGLEDLTLKTVEKLKGKSTVSRQFISDLSNAPDLKQGERDLIRKVLNETSGDKVNVKEFADRIKNELLPLKTLGAGKFEQAGFNRYENVNLPDELRGNVSNYKEVIYRSPIKTEAGKVHFSDANVDDYFAHVRVEDMAGKSVKRTPSKVLDNKYTTDVKGNLAEKQGDTRRILEIQSDLFQKGRMKESVLKSYEDKQFDKLTDTLKTNKTPREIIEEFGLTKNDLLELSKRQSDYNSISPMWNAPTRQLYKEKLPAIIKEIETHGGSKQLEKNLAQLEPYRNVWHERVIKEEIKRAAKDGKTKLQLPTGETAMKVEGLGGGSTFTARIENNPAYPHFTGEMRVTAENANKILKPGQSVWYEEMGEEYFVIGKSVNGEFRAIARNRIVGFDDIEDIELLGDKKFLYEKYGKKETEEIITNNFDRAEQFNVSGKIDTSNPIYQFYEKDVQKFLQRISPDMKKVTDPQGVSWFEINIDKALAKMPVEAFGAIAGVEVDDHGKISFSPEKAALGVAGMAGLRKVGETGPVQALKSLTKGKQSKIQEIIGEYQKHINTAPAKEVAVSLKEGLSKVYTAVIDRFNPITKLAKKAGKLLPGENPATLARRYLGIQGIAESKLFWNTTKLTTEGNLEVTGKGLSKILKPVKDNIDDLRTLMVAQRDLELAKRILPTGEKVAGTMPKQSKEVLNALKNKYGVRGFSKLVKATDEVRDWAQKTLLDPLLEVGALSKEKYQTIIKSNKFYVPFQRVIEELESKGFVPKKANLFTPKSLPIKRLKGSTKQIIDPFESLITNTYKVTDFVERARVAKSITNLRNISAELGELIKPIKTKIVPVAKHEEELIFRPSFFTPEKNTMMVFENGKRKFYQVSEDVYQAVTGMMEADVGAIMKMLAYPAKLLRAGATLTPEFMGRNPIRDQFTAFVFSKYGYVPGVDLVKGIWNTVGKTDLHGKWLASGGAHSMLVSLDRVTSQATLKKVLGAKDIKGLVKNPVEALRILSEFGEKGTRVGAFGRAVKKGVSDLEAGFESRDITLDFARRGSQTRAVNMLVAFWNAQVQGLNKLTRAFRDKPMQTTFKAVSGITLPSVLLYLHNRNDPRYQEIPQWQKDLFWVIPVGDDGPIIRIPKPFEVGIIFGTVPEHILSWVDNKDPEALKSVGKTLLEASAPGYIPTALQPMIENVSNYSFFKQQPIVSESAERLPKELQANRYTSETAKKIGEKVKYSPAKIDNLISGYTAGLGKYAIEASDKLLKELGIVSPPPAPAKTAADMPFIKAFLVREPIGSSSESVNKFYEYYTKANQAKTAVTALAEKGEEEQAVNYLKEHPEGFYAKGLNKVARTFSELRQKRDAVLNAQDIDPDQKKKALDALDKIMTEIARQTLELVKSSGESLTTQLNYSP